MNFTPTCRPASFAHAPGRGAHLLNQEIKKVAVQVRSEGRLRSRGQGADSAGHPNAELTPAWVSPWEADSAWTSTGSSNLEPPESDRGHLWAAGASHQGCLSLPGCLLLLGDLLPFRNLGGRKGRPGQSVPQAWCSTHRTCPRALLPSEAARASPTSQRGRRRPAEGGDSHPDPSSVSVPPGPGVLGLP